MIEDNVISVLQGMMQFEDDISPTFISDLIEEKRLNDLIEDEEWDICIICIILAMRKFQNFINSGLLKSIVKIHVKSLKISKK